MIFFKSFPQKIYKLCSHNKMMKEEIKAIIFDVNGVLMLGEGKSVHEYVSKKLHTDLESWFDSVEPYWTSIVKDESKTNFFLRKVSNTFNVSSSKINSLLKESFKKRFHPNKQLLKTLPKLGKKYKTAILSDQTKFSYEVFEKNYSLSKRVDLAVWSQKEKIRKPDKKIFRLVLKRLKIPAKNCVFIDNRDWNLEPAKKLGMKTILFKTNKQLFKQLKLLGVEYE